MFPSNSTSGEKSGFNIWGKKSVIPTDWNIPKKQDTHDARMSYPQGNRTDPQDRSQYQNINAVRVEGGQPHFKKNFIQANQNYRSPNAPNVGSTPKAKVSNLNINSQPYQNPQLMYNKKFAMTPRDTNSNIMMADDVDNSANNEIQKEKTKWGSQKNLNVNQNNLNNIQPGIQFRKNQMKVQNIQSENVDQEYEYDYDYEVDQTRSEYSYQTFHPIKEHKKGAKKITPKTKKETHPFTKKFPQAQDQIEENFEKTEFETGQLPQKNKFKKKIKLSKKNSISKKEDLEIEAETKPSKIGGGKMLEKKESKEFKPKIDINKLKELELKRKIVKDLEEKERNRSTSPLSVNMIKTSLNEREQNNLQINLEKKMKQKELEKEQEQRDLSEYIPKNQEKRPTTQKAKLTYMCNPKEMKDRESKNSLSIFEADPVKSYYDDQLKRYVFRVKPEFAIKIFSRPAADTVMDDPDNIRTPETLTKTIDYILDEIVDADQQTDKFLKSPYHEINFKNISTFIEDRFRGIRQDFTILNLKGDKNCIEGHERIARFLILCLNECLDYGEFTGHQGLLKQIVQQLNATLASLREFYYYVNENQGKDGNTSEELYFSPNQGEFYSYSILLSILEKSELASMLNKIPDYLLDSTHIKFAKKIIRAVVGKECLTYFKIMKSEECEYLTACLMSLHFKDMREALLSEITKNSDIKIKDSIYRTSINKFTEILLFEDSDECLSFLEWFGIGLSNVNVYDDNSIFELVKVVSPGDEANLPKKANRRIIEAKRTGFTRKDVIK